MRDRLRVQGIGSNLQLVTAAMGNDVDGREIVHPLEVRRDLPETILGAVIDENFDARVERTDDRLVIHDLGVDENDSAGLFVFGVRVDRGL